MQDAPNLSKGDVLQALESAIVAMPQSVSYMVHLAYTKRFDLKFLAYEGGSDTFGGNSLNSSKEASYFGSSYENTLY